MGPQIGNAITTQIHTIQAVYAPITTAAPELNDNPFVGITKSVTRANCLRKNFSEKKNSSGCN